MEYDQTNFFCPKESIGPRAHLHADANDVTYPITLKINGNASLQYKPPNVTIFMNRTHWINFKNSVLAEDARLERERRARNESQDRSDS